MARKKAASLGLDGAQHDGSGRRVIAASDQVVLMDFAHHSERRYRGSASARNGHDGRRVAGEDAKRLEQRPGTFVGERADRRRWTTCLRPEALDVLHDMAVELGIRRCDVVERLLLDPGCIERLRTTR